MGGVARMTRKQGIYAYVGTKLPKTADRGEKKGNIKYLLPGNTYIIDRA